MGKLRALVLLLLAGAALACAPVSVSVDYDPGQDFSGYHTFTWLPRPQPETGDYRIDNPLLDQRIRAAVERSLAEHGYRKVEDRTPDFYVAYHLQIEQKLDIRTVDRGYYSYWGYYVPWPETQVTQYDEGSLVIDVADTKRKELVWRGVGVGRVQRDQTPEESTRRVNEAVDAILAKFPPQPR